MATTTGEPLVGVVVPVFDVAGYLDDCLGSVTGQDVDAIEVVVVDDGSTDGSGDLADAWAERDPRVRVIHQEHRGLGHARNAGIAAARGTYLAFLDGDDLVPPDGYREMMSSLEATRSDVATGNVLRLEDGATSQSPLHRGIFRRDRLATTLAGYPRLLRDRTATNKLWRRDFFDRAVGRFPEGVLYEDVFVVVPALARAGAIDVLGLPVYVWRRRSAAGPSITQDRTDVRHVRDRAAAVTAVRRALADLDRELATRYEVIALRSEMALFLRVFPEVDDAYRAETARRVQAFLSEADPGTLDRLDVRSRVLFGLLDRDRPDLVVPFIADPSTLDDAPIRVRGGKALLDLDLPVLDEGMLDASDEIGLDAGVTEVSLEPGRLAVEGWARLSRRLVDPGSAATTVTAIDRDGGAVPLVVTAGARGRFVAVLDPAALVAAGGVGGWRLDVAVGAGGLERSDVLRWPPDLRGWTATPPVRLPGGDGVAVRRGRDGRVTLALLSAAPLLRDVAFVGGDLVVTCVGAGGAAGEGWSLELRGTGSTSGSVVPAEPVGASLVATVPADLADADPGSSWQLWLEPPRGATRRLRPGPGVHRVRRIIDGRELVVERTRLDGIRVMLRRRRPLLVDAAWRGDRLHLEIELPPGKVPPLALAGGGDEVPIPVTGSAGLAIAEVLVPAGEWVVVERTGRGRPLRMDHDLLARLPLVAGNGTDRLEPVDFDAVGIRAG